MYQRALKLMSQRCGSVRGNDSTKLKPLIQVDDPPINMHGPNVFYVKQNRPLPMPPLKVNILLHVQILDRMKTIIELYSSDVRLSFDIYFCCHYFRYGEDITATYILSLLRWHLRRCVRHQLHPCLTSAITVNLYVKR